MKKGYKVVRIIYKSNELGSCIPSRGREVIYKIGEETTPNERCGPLCIFSNLKNARKFMNVCGINSRIYKCQYNKSSYDQIWHKMNSRHISSLPEKTVLANSVTILEKVAEKFVW
jgi:hypothetical protein